MLVRPLAFPFALVWLAALGCGGSGAKAVKLSVNVTLDGKPLDGAMVEFIPNDETVGRAASGLTGSDGVAKLTTNIPGDGVVPGEYKITVKKDQPRDALTKSGSTNPQDAIKSSYSVFVQDMRKNKGKVEKPKGLIPTAYGDPAKTPYKNIKIPPPDGKLDLELRSTGGS